MMWLQRLARRCRLLLQRDSAERSMDAELRSHIESEIAERIRIGMGAAEARRTTLRDFGSIEAIKEEARDARGLRPVEDLAVDLRYAGRVCRCNRDRFRARGDARAHLASAQEVSAEVITGRMKARSRGGGPGEEATRTAAFRFLIFVGSS